MAIATFRLPDGRLADFTIPDGISEQQAQELVNSYIASNPDALKAAEAPTTPPASQPTTQPPTPEDTREYGGFFGSMAEAATTLGLQDEFSAYMANPTKENRDKFIAAGESKYKSAEFGGDKSLSENWEALKQLAGSSLGFMAPAWAVGKTGAIAGAKAAPLAYKPVGAIVGAGAGMYGTLTDEYAIQTALRKAQEQAKQEAAGEEVTPLSRAKILEAAGGQTFLDAIGFRFFKGVGKMLPGGTGKVVTQLSEEEGAQVIADAIKNGTYSVANGIFKGVAKGVAVEAPQEALQQALERYGADLPVSPFNPQAWEEYKQSMLGGALLGGPMGGVDTGLNIRAARQIIREEQEAEASKGEEVEKTPEQKAKDMAERLVNRGIPRDIAENIAAEQHLGGVSDESARTTDGVQYTGADRTGSGAGVQIPGTEGEEEGLTGEPEETTGGGVGVSGGDLGSTGGTEERESGALNIPSWMLHDAAQAEQDYGAEEEGRELTQEDIDSLRASQQAGETPAPPEGVTEEEFADLMRRTTVPEEKAPEGITQEEFDDLMRRTTTPAEATPETEPVSETPAQNILEPGIPMRTRKSLAVGDVASLSRTHPEFQGIDVPEKAIDIAATRIAQAAARGESLDPVAELHDAITKVGEKTRTTRAPAQPRPAEVPETQEGLFTQEDLSESNKKAREAFWAKRAEKERQTEPLRRQLNKAVRYLAANGQMNVDLANKLIKELQSATADTAKISKIISDTQNAAAESELEPETIDQEEVPTIEDEENIDYETGRDTGYSDIGEPTELTGRGLRFSRTQEAPTTGVNQQDASRVVSEATSGWKNAPRVVMEPATDTTTKGWYDPETETVHLVPENNSSPAELKATLFHESLGHKGLADKFDDQLEQVMADIYNTNPAVKAEADAWLKDNPDADGAANKQARAAEEVLARRSEGGPIKQAGIRAALNRVAAFIREFLRKNLGIVKTYSNNDVAQIIRQAQERVTKGKPKAKTGVKGKRFSKMKRQEKSIHEAEHKLQAAGKDEATILDALKDMIKGRTELAKDELDALADASSTTILEKWFPQRTGTALREWAIKKLPELARPLEAANDLTNEFLSGITKFLNSFSETSKRLEKFLNTNGKKKLARVIIFARLHGVSAASWKANTTLDEAIKNDDIIKQYEALKAKTKDAAKVKRFDRKIEERTNNIKQVYDAWQELGKQKNGHGMYKELMEYFRDMYLITRKLLDQDIERLNISKEDKEKLKKLAKKADEEEVDDDGIVYKNFVESYFPWKRFGDRWLAVKNGPFGREFYTDFSAFKLGLKERRLRKLYGEKATFEKGSSLEELRKKYASDLPLLNDIIDILNKAKTDKETDLGVVKDDIVQLWLSTLGERSLRKKMMHSEDIAGFSDDLLSVFNDYASATARQIPKLMYGNRIRNEFDAALELIKDAIQSGTITSTLGEKLKTTVNILKGRAELDLNPKKPSVLGKIGRGFNRFSYVNFLSGAATAALQHTNLLIRVIPTALRHYGEIETSKMLGKYLNVYKSLGFVRRTQDNTVIIPGEEEFSWEEPSVGVGASSLIKNNPTLQKLFKYGNDHEAFTGVRTSAVQTIPALNSKFSSAVDKAEKIFTMLYNANERISREITYMMFAELEYKKLMKDEKWKQEQKDKGLNVIEEAIQLAGKKAVQYTGDTQGRYTTSERPNIMQNEFFKVVLQFKMWAVNQFRWMFKAGRELAGGDLGALYELGGAFLMVGVILGGLTDLPFYSVLTGLFDLLGFGDDKDPKDKDYNATFLGSDADGYFRYRWLPKHFGAYKINVGDKEYSMSSVLERGVFPVFSGVDTGPRVSLDSMWWREPQYSPTLGGKILSAIGANFGPTLSGGVNYARGASDLAEGNILDAALKMSPAPVKATLARFKLDKEGAVTKSGDKLIEGELSSLAKLGVSAGFQATDIADAQNRRNRWFRGAAKYDAEKAEILSTFNKLRYEPEKDISPEELKKFQTKYADFNKKYPLLQLDEDTMSRSADAYDKKRQSALYGVSMTPEELAMNTWFLEGRPITKPPKTEK